MTLQIYSSSLYRFIGTSLRSLVLGTSVAVIIMLLTMLGSGFLILRKQMPAGWSWMFWVSPLQYALTGLANNEFLGDSYDDSVLVEGVERRFGEVVMQQYQFNIGNKWRCGSHQCLLPLLLQICKVYCALKSTALFIISAHLPYFRLRCILKFFGWCSYIVPKSNSQQRV